jgi:hypothetical protein
MHDDVISAAAYYRTFGWNPLPSRPDAKRPWISYRRYWDRPYPAKEFDRIATARAAEWGHCNLQLVTGARWGLACVDLDGPEAMETWAALSRFRPDPETWRVESYGTSGEIRGVHLYYTLPPGVDRCPSRRLWGVWDHDADDWAKRMQIEFKGDLGLIVAPPSRHKDAGCLYAVRSGFGASPPAELPAWVLSLPPCNAPRPVLPPRLSPSRTEMRPVDLPRGAGYFYDWRDVLRAIPDKIGVIQSWGRIEFTGRRRAPDAEECHAWERKDSDPSAMVNVDTGRYFSPWIGEGTGHRSLGFFELAVALGVYGDFHSAVHDLGRRHLGMKGRRNG